MPRPPRIDFPDAVYHVTSRGNGRAEIFWNDEDRRRFLAQLGHHLQFTAVVLYAYVLMDNHEHLFVQTPEPNLSAGMQYLGGSYTSYFNRRHRRNGHLFQGRFRGHLIEEEGYFLEVSRYVHLNPVRAKMVRRPEEYPWSSCGGYLRLRQALPWVTYEQVLGEFGRDPRQSRRAYRRFLAAGVEEPPTSPFRTAARGLLLGTENFVARVQEWLAEKGAEKGISTIIDGPEAE